MPMMMSIMAMMMAIMAMMMAIMAMMMVMMKIMAMMMMAMMMMNAKMMRMAIMMIDPITSITFSARALIRANLFSRAREDKILCKSRSLDEFAGKSARC